MPRFSDETYERLFYVETALNAALDGLGNEEKKYLLAKMSGSLERRWKLIAERDRKQVQQ